MKAFTVYQPYAFAIAAGLKHYETRPRRTSIRGRVAVHAGKRDAWRTGLLESGDMPEVERVLAEVQGAGNRAARLEYGAVIGTVEIVDCVPVENLVDSLDDRERLLGDYSPGRFAWVLENPVMFDEPFPARGKQGWWNWDEEEACRRRIKKATYKLALNFLNHKTPGSSFLPPQELTRQAGAFLLEMDRNGEIAIEPEKQEILLGDIPLDVLPLLPTAYSEIDEYGTYRVRQNGQFIGTAIYSGPAEWNRAENICHFGTKTIFRPVRPMETTVIEFLTDESDGENT